MSVLRMSVLMGEGWRSVWKSPPRLEKAVGAMMRGNPGHRIIAMRMDDLVQRIIPIALRREYVVACRGVA